jgi:serine/threonine-protein kinase
MFSQLLSQPPIPLNQARQGLRFSSAVESVVMRALSKDPSKRYEDSVTFASELTQALANPQEDEDDAGLLARMKSLFRKK